MHSVVGSFIIFRVYVPNYSNNPYEYTVTTHTYFPHSDDYFLIGYADDYIDDVKLGEGELYNDWQWNLGSVPDEQDIFAWRDGFRYPLGYLDPAAWREVEFTFGEIWSAGLLDFQYLSYTHQKDHVGLPELYGWCDAYVTDPGHTLDFPPISFGNTSIVERRYLIGSRWANESAPGLSNRFITTAQDIALLDDYDDTYAMLRLAFGIGWAVPKFSETAQFGIMINLTHLGWNDHSDHYELIRLEEVTLDIYNPPQSASINGLVFRDAQNPGDNIVETGRKIAVDATAGIINWEAGLLYGSGIIGPEGIVIALIGTAAGKAIYDYVAGHQQEGFGESPGGNSTYRQIWYNQMFQMLDFHLHPRQSKSHIVFVELSKELPKSCGAIKLVLHGEIVVKHHLYDKWVTARIAFENGIIIPIFAW